jgi:hypothetical protein
MTNAPTARKRDIGRMNGPTAEETGKLPNIKKATG